MSALETASTSEEKSEFEVNVWTKASFFFSFVVVVLSDDDVDDVSSLAVAAIEAALQRYEDNLRDEEDEVEHLNNPRSVLDEEYAMWRKKEDILCVQCAMINEDFYPLFSLKEELASVNTIRTRQLNSLSRAVFSTAPALITPTFIHDDSIRQIHFLLDFIFQSVPRGALERVLDVAILLGARLEMRALVSARRAKGQGFFFRHHPRLASVLIRFVSQDDEWEILRVRRARLREKLLSPILQVLKAPLVVHVVDQDATIRAAVERHPERLKSLLSSCVPDLHGD
jgi:hypothetical protein|tara:strand:- start:282 stop:1133 length:852 start_codon:yes stop_codon:yes gene_type:complete